ncbi:MAG: hypothetical protein EU533_06640 [Promethearchaeota archaeon]|nr:MAG: hypothetical protein EU533_06640 [Candidatus Lokiarchaeota archaeon]
MSIRNYRRRTGRIIIIFFSILFIALFLVLFLILGSTGLGTLTDFLIGLLVFLIVLPVIGIVINKIAGPAPRVCPRCNFPVSDYADYCKNCGMELLIRCPNCNRLQRAEQFACKKCGSPLAKTISAAKPAEQDYIIIQEGAKIPEKPNFCPTCGSSLKNAENLRFCEHCGAKIT